MKKYVVYGLIMVGYILLAMEFSTAWLSDVNGTEEGKSLYGSLGIGLIILSEGFYKESNGRMREALIELLPFLLLLVPMAFTNGSVTISIGLILIFTLASFMIRVKHVRNRF